MPLSYLTELQIREDIEDNSKIIFLINENICCNPSLEPSQRDSSNDGHKIGFYREIWLIIPKFSLFPLLIWSPDLSVLNSLFRRENFSIFLIEC